MLRRKAKRCQHVELTKSGAIRCNWPIKSDRDLCGKHEDAVAARRRWEEAGKPTAQPITV